GVLWAGLGSEPDLPELFRRWGSLLGIAPGEMEKLGGIKEWTKAIRDAIGTRRFLLVIDDAWRIEDALAFKVGGPNCVHLVTTRFPEIAFQFTQDVTTVIHELSVEEGVLFIGQFAPVAFMQEPDEVRALVQSVGGLPLALTLIGSYLRMQTHGGQPRRLRTALQRLHTADERLKLTQLRGPAEITPGLPPETPLSLQAVIKASDQYLHEEARYTLRALSVFPHKPNTFSEEAALAICARPPEVLDALIDAGLLEVGGPERYTLHQIIADYARLHLEDMTVEERMVQFFVSYVEAHESDYDALELEINNVLAAFEIASKREMKRDLLRGVNAFFHFLQSRGSSSLAESLLEQAELK
ncbi:MAG TPA: NB-ARC domain-containing protein, partial [Ktedonobacteraceae bacterium]|nr:NB-ARC domain-containing protein [Ktedonobacteraceae bacterium]